MSDPAYALLSLPEVHPALALAARGEQPPALIPNKYGPVSDSDLAKFGRDLAAAIAEPRPATASEPIRFEEYGGLTEAELHAKMDADPLFAEQVTEDCLSVLESARFVVRWDERGAAITCEGCGTAVALVPEGECADGPDRCYGPAIWEDENCRKHTARRCDWIRNHGLAS